MLALLLFLLSCAGTSLSPLEREIDGRVDSTIDFSILKDDDHKDIEINWPSRITAGGIATGQVISKDNSPINIESITSLSGNQVTLSGSKFVMEDTSRKRTDILQIVYTKNGNRKTESFEVRTAKKSKSCLGLYMAADNDLNGGSYSYISYYDFLLRDLEEIVQASFNENNVQVIVFLDRYKVSDKSYESSIFKDPGLYLIEGGKAVKLRALEMDPNTGSSETLRYFLDAMHDYCESDRYVLDIWSHGFSIFGAGFDASHDDDSLTPEEMRQAIETSKLGKNGLKVLLFSACLMMDAGVLYSLKDCVEAVAGSADYVPGDGSFYGKGVDRGIIGDLDKNPEAESVDIAKSFCLTNYCSYLNGPQSAFGDITSYLTYSAVDLGKIEGVALAFKNLLLDNGRLRMSFSELLTKKIIEESVFYSRASYSGTKGTGDVVDLVSMAYAISNFHPNQQIKSLASNLMVKSRNFVVEAKHIRPEAEFQRGYIGLGIFYKEPGTSSWANSQMLQTEFYQKTGWNKLLEID